MAPTFLMTKKDYDEAISKLNNRYMFEQDMTNEVYLLLRKTIQTTYLKSIYNKKNETFNKSNS